MSDREKGKAVFVTGLMVLVVFSVIAFVPTGPVAGAPVPSYIDGNWVIDSNQTYWGGKLEITGIITINQGYTLTLHRSTIVFNSDAALQQIVNHIGQHLLIGALAQPYVELYIHPSIHSFQFRP